jgi:DNA-binding transcriptional MerR regulator
MTEMRVDELAAQAGVSVEVIRSYQSRGLLPPPRHEGRVALYGPRHLERLQAIRDLKARGHSLRAVASLLESRPAKASPIPTLAEGETLSLTELSERTRVPPSLLRSLEASGVLRPHEAGGQRRYTVADVRAVRMLLSLVGGGVPMEEFMEVARVQLESSQAVAQGAVDLFLRYVRRPLLDSGMPRKEEADRLVAAFRLMIQAASELITYNFQRTVLNLLQEELERSGSASERSALRRELARRDVAVSA